MASFPLVAGHPFLGVLPPLTPESLALLRGRALETSELGQLFKACIGDSFLASRRDAAMLAVL